MNTSKPALSCYLPSNELNPFFLFSLLSPCHRKQRKRSISQRPPPAPKPQPRPQGPSCRALYQYIGQDSDEISFEVNDVLDLLKEGLLMKGKPDG